MCNNPAAKYNDRQLPDCNLELPLWQLVRASTAAPTYFPPEVIHVGTRPFVFVDGAMTMYHNPAFQLFLMATTDVYQLGWEVGVDRLLLISIGSGNSTGTEGNLSPQEMNILYHASRMPAALLAAAQQEQDFLCRIFGCVGRAQSEFRAFRAIHSRGTEPQIGTNKPKISTADERRSTQIKPTANAREITRRKEQGLACLVQ